MVKQRKSMSMLRTKSFLIHSLPFSFLNYFSSTAIFVGWLHVALQTAQGLTKEDLSRCFMNYDVDYRFTLRSQTQGNMLCLAALSC